MSKSFFSVSSPQELEQWIDEASPGELDEFKRWEAGIAKFLDEINGKAAAVNQTLQSKQHPVDLAQTYDAIISHNASSNAKKKTHPIRDKAQQIGAQEKLIDSSDYVKRVWRMDEFKDIPWNTFKDWFK